MSNLSIKQQLENQVKANKLEHFANIPFVSGDAKRALDLQFNLTEQQRIVLFVIVEGIIKTMNEAGMNKWYPDKLKEVFSSLFAYSLGQNEKIREALRGNLPDIAPQVIKNTSNNPYEGII